MEEVMAPVEEKEPLIPPKQDPAKRTKENINADYFNACAELGQEHFHLSNLQKTIEKKEYAIEKLQNKIDSLIRENVKIEQKQTVETIKENADVQPQSPITQ